MFPWPVIMVVKFCVDVFLRVVSPLLSGSSLLLFSLYLLYPILSARFPRWCPLGPFFGWFLFCCKEGGVRFLGSIMAIIFWVSW